MRRGVVLAGMAALFAAMLGRAGLVDWAPIVMGTLLVLVWGGLAAGVLVLVVGLPTVFVLAICHVIKGLVRCGPVPPPYSALSRKN